VQVTCIKEARDAAPEQPIQNRRHEQRAETGQEAKGKAHHEQAGTLNPRGNWSKLPLFPLPRGTDRKKAKAEINGQGACRKEGAHYPLPDRKLVSHTLNDELSRSRRRLRPDETGEQ